MGEIEVGTCSICSTKQVTLSRKYYYYDLDCSCCNGDKHFHIVRYCENCEPKPPTAIWPTLHPEKYAL